MFSLLLRCAPEEEDRLTAELWEQGTAGVSDEPGGLRAFFEEASLAGDLLQRFARFSPELRVEVDTDWQRASEEAWPPLLVGERFFLAAPWRSDPTPAGRIRLPIYPGMACGTGHHPATQLCLEAMERTVKRGDTVLDVGSGSGILSQAAVLLGAAQVIGCDIDEEAVRIARERVDVPFFVGSVDAVVSSVADVIVANISSPAAEELAADLRRVRKMTSALILSGFEEDDTPEGYVPAHVLSRGGWSCFIVRG